MMVGGRSQETPTILTKFVGAVRRSLRLRRYFRNKNNIGPANLRDQAFSE